MPMWVMGFHIPATLFVGAQYHPPISATAIFMVAFLLAFVALSIQIVRNRIPFMISAAIGALLEVVGYATCLAWDHKKSNVALYTAQSMLIEVVAAFTAMSVFLAVNHVTLVAAGTPNLVRFQRIAMWSMYALTAAAMTVEAIGAGWFFTGTKTALVIAGKLIVWPQLAQIALIAVGIVYAMLAGRKIKKSTHNPNVPYRRYLWAIYATSGLLQVRGTIRCLNIKGDFQKNEIIMFLVDAFTSLFALIFMYVGNFKAEHKIDEQRSIDTETQGSSEPVTRIHSKY